MMEKPLRYQTSPMPALEPLGARALRVADGVSSGGLPPTAKGTPPPSAALVVEDSPLNQVMLRTLLGRCGVTCTLARDGAEAVRLHAQHEFGMVIMDLDMPMDAGLAAAEVIRRQARERGDCNPMSLIAYSANADMLSLNTALRDAGFTGHLRKPCDLEALRSCLRPDQE
jgi:two-component system, sensor histidine kinase